MGARRVEGLVVQRVEGEVLIIRESTEEAHALNETAAIVFDLCDGETDTSTMAAEVARRTGLPADEAIVSLALSELEDAGVIVRETATEMAPDPVRRSLIRKLALTAAAAGMLPFVETILTRPASAGPPPCGPGRPPGRPPAGPYPPDSPPGRPGCEVPTPTPTETDTDTSTDTVPSWHTVAPG